MAKIMGNELVTQQEFDDFVAAEKIKNEQIQANADAEVKALKLQMYVGFAVLAILTLTAILR